MKRILILMMALTLLLTACTAGESADSEVPSVSAAQTLAPETASPSETPEPTKSTGEQESSTMTITINGPSGLADAVGGGGVQVAFTLR